MNNGPISCFFGKMMKRTNTSIYKNSLFLKHLILCYYVEINIFILYCIIYAFIAHMSKDFFLNIQYSL